MSTYSTNLRLELIGTGEQQGSWGNTTNTNLGTLLEQAITGYASITVTDGADTTLTTANGASDQARNMVINLTGALTAARNVICPGTPKVYIVKNSTTGGYAVTFKVSGQTGVSIPNGATYLLFVDGTDARQATGDVTSGGTGLSSYTTGDILYASGTSTIAKLADVATGNALISGGVGVAPSYGKIGLTTHVSGTLPATNGGTGLSTYAVGDIVYANTTSTLASLAGVATGNALISGGVGTAPSYGKIGLTTHVSGTLPVANGGTGVTTSNGTGSVVLNTSPTISGAILTGNSVAVTAPVGTNTTQIATTAFVQAASSSYKLLATLTTTSGTTQTASGLSLSSYKQIYVQIDGVSPASAANGPKLQMAGQNISTGFTSPSYVIDGYISVDLLSGFGNYTVAITGDPPGGSACNFAVKNSTTSITFDWDTSTTFDAGKIYIYGIA